MKRAWLWLLLLVPLVLGVLRLRFDVEVLDLLPSNEPVVQGLKLYQQNFANARELLITLRAPDPDTAESTARFLAGQLRLQTHLISEVSWQPPWLEHPAQGAELLAYLWLNQPPNVFGQLTNRLAETNLPILLTAARERLTTSFSPDDIARLSYDPLDLMRLPEGATPSAAGFGQGQELFASADGTFRLLFVEAREELASYRDCVKWFEAVRGIVRSAMATNVASGPVTLKFTGRPAFVAEIGGGMERDMGAPSAGTLVVIAVLFYLTHRRWRPLLWLVALLILILAGTLALGGLFYGRLNVISLGFASILLGLAEDFGIVLYQESQTHPHASLREIRREAAPGIFWSAVTTAGAFLLLNLSGLPGLGQLGSLVAIGIGLAAVVMLYAYLPPLLGKRADAATGTTESAGSSHELSRAQSSFKRTVALSWGFTAALLVLALVWLSQRPPHFDRSPDSLKPRNSEANAALDEIKKVMNREQEPLWVVVQGHTAEEVSSRLAQVELVLARAMSNGWIASYTLPESLWPNAPHQSANRSAAQALAGRRESLRAAALAHGFSTNSLMMTESMLQTWQDAAAAKELFWPTNDNSRWVMEKLTARPANRFLAIGLIHPHPGDVLSGTSPITRLSAELPREGVSLSGWELLGASISQLVMSDLPKVVVPILGLVLVSLWLAFRSVKDVLLSLGTVAFSGLALLLLMNLAGWSWNLMNLMAVPLLLGMGVDFSIHIQLALRRHKGDLRFVRRSVGRALLLAGSTTVAGFASVAFSSNAGLASLGKICAAGIACAMVTAIYLLPVWWHTAAGKQRQTI